jgi:hypothetical protein
MLNKCNPYHNKGKMINNIPFSRKEASTFLALSAAIALLLMSSPLVLSNLLLQPVQATVLYTSLQTPNPVALGDNCNVANAQITFDAQGSPSSGSSVTLTSGTFQVTDISSGQTLWSGDLSSGSIAEYDSNTEDTNVEIVYNVDNSSVVCGAGEQLWVYTYCLQGPPPSPSIVLETDAGAMGGVNGAVDCSTPRDTTAQPSSSPMTATTTQDSIRDSRDGDGDRDGIPDSSDRCTHNSNPRCFKEGEASTTTTTTTNTNTTQQQSSSSMSGNQTKDR